MWAIVNLEFTPLATFQPYFSIAWVRTIVLRTLKGIRLVIVIQLSRRVIVVACVVDSPNFTLEKFDILRHVLAAT